MSKYNDICGIGSGGFGQVTRCARESDGAEFAKKTLMHHDDDAVSRFKREVRLLSSMKHPNIIKVIAKRLNAAPYSYIMPLYGKSLDDELAGIVGERRRIEKVFSHILDGVAYAHEQGVIHRDIKPLNVLLNSDDDVVVTDFGLGRQIESDSSRQTSTGSQLGTALYMAPEQFVDSKSVDARCDVFALGRVLIEMFTGTLSPGGQDLSAIPPRILSVVKRATHQDPNRRFESAVELQAAWVQALDIPGVSGRSNLEQMVEQFAVDPTHDGREIERLVVAFGENLDDGDAIHSAVMKLPDSVLASCFEWHLDSMVPIVDVFASFVEEQTWSFEYTDTLARKFVWLFDNIDLPEVRARIIGSVAQVGYHHNRFFVLGRAAWLIERCRAGEEEIAVVDVLTHDNDVMECIGDYLSPSKLAPRLRELYADYEDV